MDFVPPVQLTTWGAFILSMGGMGTALVWRLVPPKQPSRDFAIELSVLSNEIHHLRQDIAEIKAQLRMAPKPMNIPRNGA